MNGTTRATLKLINQSRCPACGCRELVAGPWGGVSRNVYCPHCLAGWNAHGAYYGTVIAVDSIGIVDGERLAWARATYPDDQPWRLAPQPGAWKTGAMITTDVRAATHVKVDGRIERIAEKWGIDPQGRLAKPSQGGFGVVTETGRRVPMWEAELYFIEGI